MPLLAAIKTKKMKESIEKAKSEFQSIGESILAQNPLIESTNKIERLSNQLKRLQSFLTDYSEQVTEKSNKLLEEYDSEYGDSTASEYREKLIESAQSLIFRFRDEILEV